MGCLCQQLEQLILETQLHFKQRTVVLSLADLCQFINPNQFSSGTASTAHRSVYEKKNQSFLGIIKVPNKYKQSYTRIGIDTMHCSFYCSSVSFHDYFFCFPCYVFMLFQHHLQIPIMLGMTGSSSSGLIDSHTSENICTQLLVRVEWR